MEPRDPSIGERVMVMRRRRGLTQQELASKAQMSKTALNRLENGLQSVYAERLATLARFLGVSSDYLLGLQTDTDVPPRAALARETASETPPPAPRPRRRPAASVG